MNRIFAKLFMFCCMMSMLYGIFRMTADTIFINSYNNTLTESFRSAQSDGTETIPSTEKYSGRADQLYTKDGDVLTKDIISTFAIDGKTYRLPVDLEEVKKDFEVNMISEYDDYFRAGIMMKNVIYVHLEGKISVDDAGNKQYVCTKISESKHLKVKKDPDDPQIIVAGMDMEEATIEKLLQRYGYERYLKGTGFLIEEGDTGYLIGFVYEPAYTTAYDRNISRMEVLDAAEMERLFKTLNSEE